MPERWRDIAGPVGLLPTGERNAITDVPGVLVGHSQAESGELTGVTVVAPPSLPVRAGVATVNGVGELTKKLEIDEWGIIQTGIYLCGTHALGMVYHAAVLAEGGDPDNTLIPVVGECDDSDLADSRTVTVDDVMRAKAALATDVAGGLGRRRHRHDLLRVRRRHRHRLAADRRAHAGRAADVQLRRARAADRRAACGSSPADEPAAARGLVHRRLRHATRR